VSQADPPSSHFNLLRIARSVRAAAAVADDDALHSELCRLRTALMDHVHAEREQWSGDTDPVARIVEDGQHRLLRLVDDLLFGPRDDAEECSCLVRAAEVEAALRRQARLEMLVCGTSTRETEAAAAGSARRMGGAK